MLEADHRQVEALFETIDKADGDDRLSLIDELKISLLVHMQLEERVLYPAMAPATGEESVEEGNKGARARPQVPHRHGRPRPGRPRVRSGDGGHKAGIEHHVEEEEGEIFPKLRKDATILQQISTPFMQTRMELGLPMDAEALAAASTKDELLEEAKNAGIDGAASMTKEELAGALASTMSH